MGSITEEHMKEGISTAYVMAIAHYSGLNFQKSQFDYGMDGTFSSTEIYNGKVRDNGFKLDFQLKASKNITIEGNIIKYDLESKNYNDLVKTNVGTPRILILYKMPEDRNNWIEISENGTIFKDNAWWCSLKGMDETNNTSKKRIEFSATQKFNETSLKELMSKIEKGESI